MNNSFIEDNDQTRARREHLEQLRQLVGNVYPNKFARSNIVQSRRDARNESDNSANEDTITNVVKEFRQYEPTVAGGERPTPEAIEQANAALDKTEVRLSGRIATPPRVMGKAAFVHLSDGVSRLQIYVRKADVRAVNNDTGKPIEDENAGWQLFNLLDHGDFIGVAGYLFITKTGELSVHVRELYFLAKALLPMPDKMHGISDPEIRQRQRYADLIAGSLKIRTEEEEQALKAGGQRELSTREVFELRSKLIREMRRYLDDHGYLEVETPMLTPKATGAAAKPFKTHHNALDIDLFARIAPELYLKRLVVGGFEKVYELNRNFRNEGISTRHNPEFTMLEFYSAYMDVNGMMDFCEEMLRTVVVKVTGKTFFTFEKKKPIPSTSGIKLFPVDKDEPAGEAEFADRFDRFTMKEAIGRYWLKNDELRKLELKGEELKPYWLDEPKRIRLLFEFMINRAEYEEKARVSLQNEFSFGDEIESDDNEEIVLMRAWQHAIDDYTEQISDPSADETARHIAYLFEALVERKVGKKRPTFITDFPKPISPLSKASPADSSIAERFELFIAGMECANGFSELNDPEEQRERFLEQQGQRERGDEEAMVLDEDYIRALSYGMPPAAGIGIGIDRLVMILAGKRSIRDVILFPHMRPEREAEEREETPTPEHE